MTGETFRRVLAEVVARPTKKPIWYAVRALTGIRIQMTTRYFDGTMLVASFRAPLDKIRERLPSSRLTPIEVSPGFASVLAGIVLGIFTLQVYNQTHVFPIPYAILVSILLIVGILAMFIGLMLHVLPNILIRIQQQK